MPYLTTDLLKWTQEHTKRCRDWFRLKRWIAGYDIEICEKKHKIDNGYIQTLGQNSEMVYR